MTTVTDLQNRKQYYASNDLIEQLEAKVNNRDTIINFAYTDYGGTFFDKVCIAYFTENHPNNIVSEPAAYYGQNAFIFGDIAAEFLKETDRYPLGFETIEEYFYEKEREERDKGMAYFISSLNSNKYEVTEDIPDEFIEYIESYCNILTSGLDYCESDMILKGIEYGLIKEIIDAE